MNNREIDEGTFFDIHRLLKEIHKNGPLPKKSIHMITIRQYVLAGNTTGRIDQKTGDQTLKELIRILRIYKPLNIIVCHEFRSTEIVSCQHL